MNSPFFMEQKDTINENTGSPYRYKCYSGVFVHRTIISELNYNDFIYERKLYGLSVIKSKTTFTSTTPDWSENGTEK